VAPGALVGSGRSPVDLETLKPLPETASSVFVMLLLLLLMQLQVPLVYGHFAVTTGRRREERLLLSLHL